MSQAITAAWRRGGRAVWAAACAGRALPQQRQIAATPHRRGLSSSSTAAAWQMAAAACLERYPRITSDKTELELEWEALAEQIQIEKSALTFEEVEEEKAAAKARKAAARSKDEAGDIIGAFTSEETAFVPASRETDADRANDRRSVQRCLQHKLVLAVEGQALDGSSPQWQLPQALRVDGETLRQTAERALLQAISEDTNVYFLSNAPNCCLTLPDTTGKHDGLAIFFYRAVLIDNEPTMNKTMYSDYLWLTPEEMGQQLTGSYKDSVQRFLY